MNESKEKTKMNGMPYFYNLLEPRMPDKSFSHRCALTVCFIE